MWKLEYDQLPQAEPHETLKQIHTLLDFLGTLRTGVPRTESVQSI